MSRWYYSIDGRRLGPVSEAELRSMAEAGTLHSSVLVWRHGMPDWISASQVKGLFSNQLAPPLSNDRPPPLPPERARQTVPVWVWWGVLPGAAAVIAVLILFILVLVRNGANATRLSAQSANEPAPSPSLGNLTAKPAVTPVASSQTGQKTLAYWMRVKGGMQNYKDAGDVGQAARAARSVVTDITTLDRAGVDEIAVSHIRVLGAYFAALGAYFEGCVGGFTQEEVVKGYQMMHEMANKLRVQDAEVRQDLQRKYAIDFPPLLPQ